MEELEKALLEYYSGTDTIVSPYLRVAYSLKAAIANELIKAGDPMPSIRYLADLFKVNPGTAGKALHGMDGVGLTVRHRGRASVLADGAKEVVQEQAEQVVQEYNIKMLKRTMTHFNISIATITKWLKEKGE